MGARVQREGSVHHGFERRFAGRSHRIDLSALTGGKVITMRPQYEVLTDLIAARLATGGDLRFDVRDTSVHDLAGPHPCIRFTDADGRAHALECDFIAGCDGFHGVCRDAIPASARTECHRVYPFGWFGILAEAPPSSDELIYARYERGFALVSTRSSTVQRMYFQCPPDERPGAWSQDRIWHELHARTAADGFRLKDGPIAQHNIIAMCSFVCEPMRHERLFLAGDAAHVVPPTGRRA